MRKTLHNTYPLWSRFLTVMALISICVFTMAGFANKASARDYVQQEVHGKYIQNTLVLSERVIEIKLLEQGYSDFVGYEVFHGLYKVRAKNKVIFIYFSCKFDHRHGGGNRSNKIRIF